MTRSAPLIGAESDAYHFAFEITERHMLRAIVLEEAWDTGARSVKDIIEIDPRIRGAKSGLIRLLARFEDDLSLINVSWPVDISRCRTFKGRIRKLLDAFPAKAGMIEPEMRTVYEVARATKPF